MCREYCVSIAFAFKIVHPRKNGLPTSFLHERFFQHKIQMIIVFKSRKICKIEQKFFYRKLYGSSVNIVCLRKCHKFVYL